MIKFFKKSWRKWNVLLHDRAYIISLLVGVIVIVGSYLISYSLIMSHESLASTYVSVEDALLSRIPVVDLHILDIWGFLAILISIFVYVVFFKPEIAPFAMKTFGILLLVRACFIIMTHVGPPIDVFRDPELFTGGYGISRLFLETDLFFSGHTSIPFLAFLILKDSKIFRWVMLFATFVMAATVLLMHVHYSIDVFAAFFIAHGIYSISNKVFKDLNKRFKKLVKVGDWDRVQKY